MKRGLVLLILILAISFSFGQTKVNYKVFYSENLQNEGLKIQVSFSSKKVSDSTYFQYSNEVWGETNLTNCLKFIEKENPKYKFKIVADSSRIVVYHPKEKSISFSYHIIQDVKQENLKSKNRPLLQKEYFHILGQSLFIVPEEIFDGKIEDPKITANIEWLNFPKNFIIHNTFGSQQLKQNLKVKLWSEFYHSLFVGGDYRIKSFNYLEKPVYFAIRGKWLGEYTDDNLFEALKKTIPTQREFWKDNDFDYYTVIITPTITQTDSAYSGQSITGTGIKNGFIIRSSNNPFNDFSTMNHIFNHEMMHDWIGGKISIKHEELNYWFSEGFTDYYTYKNRLRNNDLTLKEWLSSFNTEVIKAHWENPERNKPNYVIKDDFWKSENVEKIPYRRGAIFAFWLDNQILKKSNCTKSLDDLMRDILKICTTENRKFTDELFLEIAQKYLDKDIAYFFQKHIINGLDFELKNEDLIDGFQIEYVEKVPKIVAEKEVLKKYILK
ncbi:peptidase [Riemerella anatipestifer]|uniref:M1 family aminopeptidase n=1 Tax=Riemerella anatipestifer TaxID=34085 RepID=UPI000D140FED|nr:M1 family aminopeptidase [Riemerella anatipestifer]MDD1523841.1 peptidase [Riemerella anatipestifer]PST45368.1 peptidase [Riemerella anatipestifer]